MINYTFNEILFYFPEASMTRHLKNACNLQIEQLGSRHLKKACNLQMTIGGLEITNPGILFSNNENCPRRGNVTSLTPVTNLINVICRLHARVMDSKPPSIRLIESYLFFKPFDI